MMRAVPRAGATTVRFLTLAVLVLVAGTARSLAAQETPVSTELPSDGARPITLDEAVQLAHRNSPLAVQARGQERTARAAVRSAYAAFIPSLDVSAGNTRRFNSGETVISTSGERQTVEARPTYNTGLSLGVTLFDGGRRFFDIGASRAGVAAAEANDVSQRFRLALDVSQQFYAAVAARESEAAARAQLGQAEQQLRASVTRLAAGAATLSDSLRSVIAVGNARLALITARNDLNVANAALTRLVGSEDLVTAALDDTSTQAFVVPADTAQLFALAQDGPAIRQAEANLAAARADRRSARAPYLPTISASYSRSGSGVDSRFGSGNAVYACPSANDPDRVCESYAYNGSLSFNLRYPLFNQLAREEQVVRADVAEDVARATLRDARLQARQSLVQYLGALQTAQQRVTIQGASVAAAEEDLRVQQQRYELGASTLLDVLTSQTQLDQARAELIAARLDYRVARAQIEALIGRRL
jgi:outer membrane protein